MPPFLALTLSLTFSVGMIIYDRRRGPKPSLALWIPYLWLFILGSRPLTLWLRPGPVSGGSAQDLMDGSPTDRLFYVSLMVAALLILIKRRTSLTQVVRRNPWLVLFFLYAGVSILWSDYQDVSFRRWIKSFGDPMIALVVLTEEDPTKAFGILFKRLAFVLLPLSIVFIKYFPELGRNYEPWTGLAFYTGVTTNKNLLGYLLFVFGLFFFSMLLGRTGRADDKRPVVDVGIAVAFIGMTVWLFRMADSKTPLLCLVLAGMVYVGSGIGKVRKYWGTSVVAALIIFGIFELGFDVSETIIAGSGRNTSLTGRTDLWKSVLEVGTNPWIGTGYASFWLGPRLEALWEQYAFHPNQAHNGYLEFYINLGWVGIVCLTGMILGGFRSLRKRWRFGPDEEKVDLSERDLARVGMAYLVALLVYNVTETTFQSVNFLFVVFLILVMNRPTYRSRGRVVATQPSAVTQELAVARLRLRSAEVPRAVGRPAAARSSGGGDFRIR